MTVALEDVRRLRLDPGDVLVARVPPWATLERAADLHAMLVAEFPDNRILVIPHDLDLGVVEARLWPSS